MTQFRIHDAATPLQTLQLVLGLRVSAEADAGWTTATCVMRRLAAIHAPCSRRHLVAKASRALRGAFEDDPAAVLHEILDDLIAGGDLTEQVGLRAGDEEAPMLIFLATPRFARTGKRIFLQGVVADDAPCLPSSVTNELVYAGPLRYLEVNPVSEMAEVLTKLGLAESSLDTLVQTPACVPEMLIAYYRTCIASAMRLPVMDKLQWLRAGAQIPYRMRWTSTPALQGLQVARWPQFYGADAWWLVDHDVSPIRGVQLPVNGLPEERGCDAAWRFQLAWDALSDAPARYRVAAMNGMAAFKVDFPLPYRERHKLLLLGGLRADCSRPYDFHVQRDVQCLVSAILEQLGFSSSKDQTV